MNTSNEVGSHSDPVEVESFLRDQFGIDNHVESILQRNNRCVALLSNSKMACFASNPIGTTSMRRERGVLQALQGKASFKIPVVHAASSDGTVDIRQMVEGVTGENLRSRIYADASIARQVASGIATVLAELHNLLDWQDVQNLVPSTHHWPVSGDWVRQRLPEVMDDMGHMKELLAYVDEFESITTPDEQKVLCHADLQFSNIAFSESGFAINGIFDFDSATFCDPNWDLRYLVFGPNDSDYEHLEHGIETYAKISTRPLSRKRILFYNLISAIAYLAFRHGIEKDRHWCGRTYDEDIGWTKLAMSKL